MSAVISGCGLYRYRLQRGDGPRRLAFVMLNPSTADADVDDPTIRRCRAFAQREGHAGIDVMNLYAWRATDPVQLTQVDDPVGPDNAIWLDHLACDHRHGWIVCAWGALARERQCQTALQVAGILSSHGARLVCLGITKDGSPRHPLYVRGDTAIADWTPPA
jgi:hypothetical protein